MLFIKFIDTPPPQNTIKGRYTYYTVCSTPDTNIHTLFNTVVLFPESVLQHTVPGETYLYHIHPPPPFRFSNYDLNEPFPETPPVTFYFAQPPTPIYFFCYSRPVGENGLAPLDFDLLLNCIQTLLYGTPTPPLHGVP